MDNYWFVSYWLQEGNEHTIVNKGLKNLHPIEMLNSMYKKKVQCALIFYKEINKAHYDILKEIEEQ